MELKRKEGPQLPWVGTSQPVGHLASLLRNFFLRLLNLPEVSLSRLLVLLRMGPPLSFLSVHVLTS